MPQLFEVVQDKVLQLLLASFSPGNVQYHALFSLIFMTLLQFGVIFLKISPLPQNM